MVDDHSPSTRSMHAQIGYRANLSDFSSKCRIRQHPTFQMSFRSLLGTPRWRENRSGRLADADGFLGLVSPRMSAGARPCRVTYFPSWPTRNTVGKRWGRRIGVEPAAVEPHKHRAPLSRARGPDIEVETVLTGLKVFTTDAERIEGIVRRSAPWGGTGKLLAHGVTGFLRWCIGACRRRYQQLCRNLALDTIDGRVRLAG
jgi:hypothetical protein